MSRQVLILFLVLFVSPLTPVLSQEENAERKDIFPTNCGKSEPDLFRIVGGRNADIYEFPWIALLFYENDKGEIINDCSGCLITEKYILTAAHCIDRPTGSTSSYKLKRVHLGVNNTDSTEDCLEKNDEKKLCLPALQIIDVDDAKPHQDWDPSSKQYHHDIGLIRLAEPVKFTRSIGPICLAKNIGTTFTAIGWGDLAYGEKRPSVLQKVELPLINHGECKEQYSSNPNHPTQVTDKQICAGGFDGKDVCAGDSGGPLMQVSSVDDKTIWEVVGVTSYGAAACGYGEMPGVYSSVVSYYDWIVEHVNS